MRAEVIGYNAKEETITFKIITIKDGESIPLGKEIELNLKG